ncbi:DUF1648 domain-containing protein [Bacillus carboniphilus]|uniref:DUF1648 domain-containing protein n=1 Tax=Bacillus carboniphilus TaxID=86663 RepID=A0ABN0WR98_9BACI
MTEFLHVTLSLIPAFVIIYFLPELSQHDTAFGVKVPKTYQNDSIIKKEKTVYRKWNLIWAIGLSGLLWFPFQLENEALMGLILVLLIFLYLGLSTWTFYQSYKRIKVWKANSDWKEQKSEVVVVDTTSRKDFPKSSMLWFILHGFVTFITIIISISLYKELPNQIPIHFNAQGEADNYVSKTWLSVLSLPFIQVLFIILFAWLHRVIYKAKLKMNPEQPELSKLQGQIFRKKWGTFFIFSSLGLTILFLFIQLSILNIWDSSWIFPSSMIYTFLVLAWVMILSFKYGQSGSRYMKEEMDAHSKVIHRDDDQFWIMGQFYFNKEDPSLIVEKRVGVGWTVNLGRPMGWVLLVGPLVVLFGIIIFDLLGVI